MSIETEKAFGPPRPLFSPDKQSGGGLGRASSSDKLEEIADNLAKRYTPEVVASLPKNATETEIIGAAVLRAFDEAVKFNMVKEEL
jgi:hypothetical protein